MKTSAPPKRYRPGQTILTGAPTESSLLQSDPPGIETKPPAEVPNHDFLPAFRRFFQLDDLTAAGPATGSAPGLAPGQFPPPSLAHPSAIGGSGSEDLIWEVGEGAWRELSHELKRRIPEVSMFEKASRAYAAVARRTAARRAAARRAAAKGAAARGPAARGTAARGAAARRAAVEPPSIRISFTSATSIDPISTTDYNEADDDDAAAAAQLLHDESAHTSFVQNQPHEPEGGDVDFLNHSFSCYQNAVISSPDSPSFTPASSDDNEITTSQFPHLLHENSLDLTTIRTTSFSTSFYSSFNSVSSSYEADELSRIPSSLPPLPPLSSLTDLEDLPSARELERIQSHRAPNPFYRPKPVSSVVGIISISQPISCRNKSEMVKLTVGDETATGVGVTIWLDSSSKEMREKLCNGGVRPLDVVLLHNVFLNTYMGNVYLNSMRNGKTMLQVLYRCGEGMEYKPDLGQNGAVKDQQVEKVRRVVEWVESFVGVGGWGATAADGGSQTILPEDTQFEP